MPVDLDLHVWMLLSKCEYQVWQQVQGCAFVCSNSHTPALEALQFANGLSDLVSQRQYSLGIVVNHLPCVRKHRRLLGSIQKWKSNLLFQPPDSDTDCGLGAINPVGSLRKTAFLHDFREIFELGHFHSYNFVPQVTARRR